MISVAKSGSNKDQVASEVLIVLLLVLSVGFIISGFSGSLSLLITVSVITVSLVVINILRRPEIGLLVVICLVPFLKTVTLPIIGHKLTLTEIVLIMTIMAWVLNHISSREDFALVNSPLNLLFFCFISVGLFSVYRTASLKDSMVEIATLIYLWLFYFSFEHLIRTEDQVKSVIKVWIVSAAVVTILGLIGVISVFAGIDTPFSRGPRVVSTFLNPNQLASYLLLSIFLTLGLVSAKGLNMNIKPWLVLLIVSMVVDLIFTGSRAGMAGFVLGAMAFLIMKKGDMRALLSYILVAITFFILTNFLFKTVKPELGYYFQRMTSLVNVVETRELLPHHQSQWKAAFKAISDHPLIGTGVGSFYEISGEFIDNPKLAGTMIHNTYLNIWAETGTLGLTAFLWMIFMVLKNSLRNIYETNNEYWRSVSIGLFVGFIAEMLYYTHHYGLRNRHLWLTIAIIMVIRRIISNKYDNLGTL